ncbi:hypothetical protein [Pandoraea sp. ISTKB]|uniref:hypothetical protein n=1 Tax=Pandoraea sp. ISTKB TaxID=1586708 RepID=UPI001112EDDB|nr:hypothetical protein [Pandoraea sp. ISTKB]
MDSTAPIPVDMPVGMTLYMLNWGDSYERQSGGPYLGEIGLDFHQLSEEYRRETFAEREAAREDWCFLSETDFASWLAKKGILRPVATTAVELEVRKDPEAAYVPKHWPECPVCKQGRGEKEYGELRRSLNRIRVFYRCTACRNEWGHREEPNDESSPMLEDDGRDTEGGCVPFAIAKACGLDFMRVAEICRKHGWHESKGMHQSHAVEAAREMGFELVQIQVNGVGGKSPPTIKQLLQCLPNSRSYVLGVRGHWLAVVGGTVVDNDTNGGMGRRVVELYEVLQSRQAVA